MKLIIQIPCYNEEQTLPITFADLPKEIDGIDTIEYLIINDGSRDRTVEVAKELGIHYIVDMPNNRGLAKGFMSGIHACLSLGADIIVNTDGDNQYNGHDIEKLVRPIIDGEAEIVIGDRETDSIGHFSPLKKKLQKLGSNVVRKASNTEVSDTTSGFRAYSRDAAMKLNVISEYTYTLETIIDAGNKKLAIKNVPISTNEKLRDSRLFSSMWGYIRKSAITITRTYAMHHALRLFCMVGILFILAGLAIGGSFLVDYITFGGAGHVQSLILSAIFIIIGVQSIFFGMLADGISALRKIGDELLYRVKKSEYKSQDQKVVHLYKNEDGGE
ncbi:MAG: glycosyl transferase [Epulopiscium sp. Nele67-Bin004]|nr:MAG: glycosyl transferase [Epulopiscium sp. Nele67-Bin004]